MRRVVKISFHVLSGFILLLIVLPVALALLLQFAPVQNFVADQAARMASNKLGTTVSLDRIQIRFFNRVVVDGFCVEGFQQDTLLYAERLDVGLATPRVLLGDLSFGEIKLSGVRFNMYQEADSTSNFKKILARLAGKPKPDKKPAKIRAAGITVEDMHYSYYKYVVPPREYGVNFGDLDITGIDLAVRDLAILGDSISMRVDHISLRDKSGLVIDGLSSRRLGVSGRGIYLEDLSLSTPDSRVEMDHLRLISETWQEYSDFTNKVKIEVAIEGSRVAFPTIAYFAPGLRAWHMVVEGLDGEVNGTVSDISGNIAAARINDTELTFDFAMRGLPDVKHTRFDLNIDRLMTNAADIDTIMRDVTGKGIPVNMSKNGEGLDTLELRGRFEGTMAHFAAQGDFATQEGGGDFDFTFAPADSGRHSSLSGKANVRSLELGKLLGVGTLGKLSLDASVNGTLGQGGLNADATLLVGSLEYMGYRYRDISMNGYFRNRQFRGNIGSNDPNIKFDFDGTLDLNDTVPRYDFDLQLFNADLAALHLNRRDSISQVSGTMTAVGSGSSLDDLNGAINIGRLSYINHMDTISTEGISLTGENSPVSKHLALRSSFADADYRSRKSYAEMFRDLRGMLHAYMPTLASSGSVITSYGDSAEDVNNYSMLNVDIKQANNVAGIFVPGFIIAQGSKLSFLFNPNIEQFSLMASSDYLEFGGKNFVSNLELNTRNQGDSISMFVRASELYASGIYMPDLSIIGAMRENSAHATMRMEDTTRNMTALIGLAATLGRDTLSGIPQARLRITPSTVNIAGKTWNIFSRGITLDSTRVVVNNFNIAGAGQSLRIDGVAGRQRSDTLHLYLSDFDLEPVTQFTSPMGYRMTGKANGHADLMSALDRGILHAGIDFDSVDVNGVQFPAGRFESTWDFERERARFMLAGVEAQDTVIRGFYNPADNRYYADLKIKELDLSLLDPVMEGVLGHSSGTAGITAVMQGSGGSPRINGSIDIKQLSTSVDFLKVPYTVTDARIDIKDNVLTAKGLSILDPGGKRAGLDMDVDLSSFSNIRYRFHITPSDMMVLNTTVSDNNMFYGKVFASGAATIRGDKGGVDMNITARTGDNSQFFLPLSDQSSMGLSDIITFKAPEKQALDDTDYLTRRRMIMQGERKIKDAAASTNMNVDMELTVLPNTDFQLLIDPKVGDILEGRGTGSLKMDVNPATGEFNMYGTCEITEGSYQFTLQDIISKRFTIAPGSRIMWTGDPADATLDVTAVYQLTASLDNILSGSSYSEGQRSQSVPVECRIMLGDRLSNPTVTFNVEVDADPTTRIELANTLGTQESMSTQFFFLLATGGFYPYDGGMGSIGSEMGTSAAIGMLNNQINKLMENDKFDLGIKYKPKSEINSDEVGVDFATGLFGDRLLLEVDGNYDTGNNPGLNSGARNNVTGDFYLTWLLDPSGSLRLKGFTRTIDRFDENQGLQESGVGIYYKEDFNTFKDIVRNFKQRFSGWSQRKKREQESESATE